MMRRHKGHKSRPGGANSQWGGEYWGRRPGSRAPDRATKVRTHRLERLERLYARRRLMTRLSKHECGKPGCRTLVAGVPYCDEHRKATAVLRAIVLVVSMAWMMGVWLWLLFPGFREDLRWLL